MCVCMCVCVCVCVCVVGVYLCVCVCAYVGVWGVCVHIKGRSLFYALYCHTCERGQDLDCQCRSRTIGHTGFERVYQGEGGHSNINNLLHL